MRALVRYVPILALATSTPALALDPGKVPPVTLGKGSTGPGDGVTVQTPAGQALALGSLLRTLPTQTPFHYGYALDSTADATAALQACLERFRFGLNRLAGVHRGT